MEESGEILDKYRFISTIIDGDTITKPMNLTVSELEALSRFWRLETNRKDLENLQIQERCSINRGIALATHFVYKHPSLMFNIFKIE